MSKERLQDSHFNTIGYIETRPDGVQVIQDYRFETWGYYDPKTNTTTDHRFQTVGHGNLLTTLLPRQ
jgi:hypothetical protein